MEEQTHSDETYKTLLDFIIDFLSYYDAYMNHYSQILDIPFSTISHVMPLAISAGESVSKAFGNILALGGILAAGGKEGLSTYTERAKKKYAGNLGKLIYNHKNLQSKKHTEEILVKACLEIFVSYEMQIMNVFTENGSHRRAVAKLASDAVHRFLDSQAAKNTVEDLTSEDVTKAVCEFEYCASFSGKFSYVPNKVIEIFTKIKKPADNSTTAGRTVTLSLFGNNMDVHTSKLYRKVGIVAIGEGSKYYKLKNTRPEKYFYRRLFKWEVIQALADISDSQKNHYSYSMSLEPSNEFKKKLLSDIEKIDRKYMEERIVEAFTQVKNELLGELMSINGKLESKYDTLLNLIEGLLRTVRENTGQIESVRFRIRSADKNFIGREEIVENIHEFMTATERPVSVICGIAGVGKTQIALKYAAKYFKQYYKHIVLIDAEMKHKVEQTNLNIEKSFQELARHMKMEITAKIPQIYEYFQGQKTLIIFDNADSLENIKRYFPDDLSGSIQIMITSQKQEWDNHFHIVSLEGLSAEESVKLLANLFETYKTEETNVALEELSKSLEYLPLALQQAAAYIIDMNKTKKYSNVTYSIMDYLKEFKTNVEQNLLELKFPDFWDTNYKQSTFTALKMNIAKIQSQGDKKTTGILYFLAFVPANYFERYILEDFYEIDEVDKALRMIDKYSLITTRSDWFGNSHAALSIHRLVKRVLQSLILKNEEDICNVLNNFMKLYDESSIQDESISSCFSSNETISETILQFFDKHSKYFESFYQNLTTDGKTKIVFLLAATGCKKSLEVILDHNEGSIEENTLNMSLICATQKGYNDVLNLLFKYNTYANLRDKLGNTLLHHAAECGRQETVELLISKGAEVNTTNDEGETPLHLAVGYPEIVDLLLKSDGDIKINNIVGDSPLHYAARRDCIETVELLLDYGADINLQNDQKLTPLFLAVSEGYEETANLLIENDADIKKRANQGGYLLHYAANFGCLEIIQLLVNKPNDVNEKDNFGSTPLHLATLRCHEDAIKLLVENGADINARKKDGQTPILVAAEHSYQEILQLLIDLEADIHICDESGRHLLHYVASSEKTDIPHTLLENDVNVQDKDGCTPLHAAIKADNYFAALSLIYANADPNIESNKGDTPLHVAVMRRQDEIVQLLINSNSDINIQNNDGFSPLLMAADLGFEDIVNLLIQSGADKSVHNNNGNCLLHYVCYRGWNTILKSLIKDGGNVNEPDNEGNTPLHFAAEGHREITLHLLLNKKADINNQNEKGDTPLHLAAKWTDKMDFKLKSQVENAKRVIKLLLKNDADLNKLNKDGALPLDVAIKNGNDEIVEILDQKGISVVENTDYKMLQPASVSASQ